MLHMEHIVSRDDRAALDALIRDAAVPRGREDLGDDPHACGAHADGGRQRDAASTLYTVVTRRLIVRWRSRNPVTMTS